MGSSAFLPKLDITLLLSFSGGTVFLFGFFKKVFRIDQYAFSMVEGTSYLLFNMLVYLSLDLRIMFEHSCDLVVRRF